MPDCYFSLGPGSSRYNRVFTFDTPQTMATIMRSFGIADFGLFCLDVSLLNITLGDCALWMTSTFGLTVILAASTPAFKIIKLAGGA